MEALIDRFTQMCKFRYLGIGFMWAWIYCLWFTPAMFPGRMGIGVNASISWFLSCVAVMVSLLATPLVMRKLGRTLESCRPMRYIAPVLQTVTTALLFIPYPSGSAALDIVFIVASIGTGIFCAWLWIMWGELHSRFNPERIETVVPASAILVVVSLFLVANMDYPIGAIIVCLLPLASGLMLNQSFSEPEFHEPVKVIPPEKSSIAWPDFFRVCMGTVMIYTVIGFGWSTITLDAFRQLGQGLEIPYLVGALFGATLSVVSIYFARRLNLFFIYRWMLPVMVCALLLLSVGDVITSEIAYVLLALTQLAFDIMIWVYFANVAHKGLYSATILLGESRGFAQIGVTLGSAIGIPAVRGWWGAFTTQSTICLVLVALSTIVIMFVLNQQEAFEQLVADEDEPPVLLETLSYSDEFKALVDHLAEENGLSKRETEVFALLARGRSFPYIREELFLSKSTVETHAKNLYRKLGVHSKQELIDLVEIRFLEFSVPFAQRRGQ